MKVRCVIALAAANVLEKRLQSASTGSFVDVECEIVLERSELLLASATAAIQVNRLIYLKVGNVESIPHHRCAMRTLTGLGVSLAQSKSRQ